MSIESNSFLCNLNVPSMFTNFEFFLGTVLAYTSTAVPSIKHDNSTFVDQNENLMAFICKYSPKLVKIKEIIFFASPICFLSCTLVCQINILDLSSFEQNGLFRYTIHLNQPKRLFCTLDYASNDNIDSLKTFSFIN